MSQKEMLYREIDTFPDYALSSLLDMISVFKCALSISPLPNAETIVACSENDFVTAKNFDEMIAMARDIDND
jgi:hypothetical protein